MNPSLRSTRRRPAWPGAARWLLVAGIVACAALAGEGQARDRAPFAARAGLDLARAGAMSWAPDAELIYIENDETLDPQGGAPRWGYLFHSPSLGRARVYSIGDGKIVVAEDLEIKFDGPPVVTQWIDSEAALRSAESGAGAEFRREHGGQLTTMLLLRGVFREDDPDATSWTLVYSAPNGPSLFVVVDAVDGKVRRTWRG